MSGIQHLFVEFHPRLVAYLSRFVGPEDAADLSMQVFVRLLERRGFDDSKPAWPYLRTIARNLAYDHLRRVRAMPQWDAHVPGGDPAAVTPSHIDLRTALASLPAEEVSVLCSVADGYKPSEIARAIGRTPHAVTCMLSRTRLKVRALLEPITIPLVAWWYRRRGGTSGPAPGFELAATMMVVTGIIALAPLLPRVTPSQEQGLERALPPSSVVDSVGPRPITPGTFANRSTGTPPAPAANGPVVVSQYHEFEKDEKAVVPRRIWFEYWVRDGDGNNIYGSETWTGCETGDPANGDPSIPWYDIIPYFESTC